MFCHRLNLTLLREQWACFFTQWYQIYYVCLCVWLYVFWQSFEMMSTRKVLNFWIIGWKLHRILVYYQEAACQQKISVPGWDVVFWIGDLCNKEELLKRPPSVVVPIIIFIQIKTCCLLVRLLIYVLLSCFLYVQAFV